MYTVELLTFVILAMLSKCRNEEVINFFRLRSSVSSMTLSIEIGFYELPPTSSVKLKNSLKHRGARLVNHLLGRNISFVGLKKKVKLVKTQVNTFKIWLLLAI